VIAHRLPDASDAAQARTDFAHPSPGGEESIHLTGRPMARPDPTVSQVPFGYPGASGVLTRFAVSPAYSCPWRAQPRHAADLAPLRLIRVTRPGAAQAPRDELTISSRPCLDKCR
jgi:hypothetical protein